MATPNGNVVALGDHPRAKARLSPQESASLLSGCRELALERMSRALGSMLDRVEDELFGLAEKATDRESQNVLLDARAQARGKRSEIEATFRRHFAEFFNRKVRGEGPAAATPALGELALVGTEDLEETLAVNEMSRKARAACEGELFALSQRMGYLLQRPELADEANPVSPSTICAALKDACDQIESGFKVRMALLHQLEAHVLSELQTIYRDLNAHLVERRVLPEIRPVARRTPHGAPKAAPADKADKADKKEAAPQDVFATLAELMGAAARGGPGPAGGMGGPQAIAQAAAPLVESLTRMHRDAIPVEGAGLVNVVRDVKAAPQAASLPALEAMTIDIVAMLFDYVFEDRHIPDSIKALLGRLQIPTLKVALIDKGFFSSKAHPARRLIDLLAEVSIGIDEMHPRGAATVSLVDEVVTKVLAEFDTDIALFESLVARVETFIAEGNAAEAVIIERSAGTIEARERAEAARLFTEDEIHRRLAGRAWVPPPVREMLEGAWTRAMAVAYEASGTGAAWTSLAQTMDDLLWSVEPKVQAEDRKRLVGMLPGLLRSLHEGFDRAALASPARDAFLGTLVDCHAFAVKAGLRGMAALPEVPVPPPPADAPVQIEREIVPADGVEVEEIRLRAPRGSGIVRNVFTRTGIWTNVQRGSWVEFGRASGEATRARLTWISPNKGVYLFTNPSSARTAMSISPEALAEQMRLGEARLLDDAPLVERAVDSVLASLRPQG